MGAIFFESSEILARTKIHIVSEVDIAVVRISDVLNGIMADKDGSDLMAWEVVSQETLPGGENIGVEVADDVLIIGYPKGYYDEVNVFPIIKSGIIASKWGRGFRGEPYFLIDAKLFPGSSGSIVITKPINMALKDGQLQISPEKQFAFLGVYSGAPIFSSETIHFEDLQITRRDSFNLGAVYYGFLIDEIINEGISVADIKPKKEA